MGTPGELSGRGVDSIETHYFEDGEFRVHVFAGPGEIEIFDQVRRAKGVLPKPAQFPGGAGRFVDDLAEGGADCDEAEFGVGCPVRTRSILSDRVPSPVLEGPAQE